MEQRIRDLFKNHGISHMGFARLERPLSLSFYQDWLDQSFHGQMDYLSSHLPSKAEPQKLLPTAKNAIVFTYPYTTSEWSENFPLQHLKIASYARKKDYHFWLREKINALCGELKSVFPQEDFLGFTDSAPVMERDLAHRAGLGWFGKNSCLIDKKNGSLFFIAEIYTSLDLQAPETLPRDHCGTCNRCVEACPTDAIMDNKTLDATKCISYWTIESREVPPEHLRKNFQGWFFGCDVCQDVCPWNGKISRALPRPQENTDLVSELRWILQSSNNQILKALKTTPLARAGGRGLKRNAMIVAANLKISDVSKDIEAYKNDYHLGELAQWSLNEISSSSN